MGTAMPGPFHVRIGRFIMITARAVIMVFLYGSGWVCVVEARPTAYVTNGGWPTVAVIDADTNTLVEPIHLCGTDGFCDLTATAVSIAPGGARAYVLSLEEMLLIDTRTKTVAGRLPFSGTDLAVSGDGRLGLIAGCGFGGSVCEFDTRQGAVIAVTPIAGGSDRVAMAPDAPVAYVTNSASASCDPGSIKVLSTIEHRVVQGIPLDGCASDVQFHPDGRRAYAVGTTGVLSVIDTNDHAVIRTIDLGAGPKRVAFAPDGRRAYVTAVSNDSEQLIVIDADSDRVAARVILSSIDTGGFYRRPVGVAVTPDGTQVYVVENEAYVVTVIDAHTLTEIGSTPQFGEGPTEIVIADVPGGVGHDSAGCTVSGADVEPFPGVLLLFLVPLWLLRNRGQRTHGLDDPNK